VRNEHFGKEFVAKKLKGIANDYRYHGVADRRLIYVDAMKVTYKIAHISRLCADAFDCHGSNHVYM
jgi:hypothetical protein